MVSDLTDYLQKPIFSTRNQRHTLEMEQRIDELAATLKRIQEQNASIQEAVVTSTALFEEVKPSVKGLAEWRPALERSVDDLRTKIGSVRRDLDTVIRNPALTLKPTDLPPLIPRSGGGTTSEASKDTHRPDGSHDDNSTWGSGSGVVTTLVPPPAMGRGWIFLNDANRVALILDQRFGRI
nr:uncharacterized protein LOC109770775 [Aegilops tauschii subsp. strangulata]